MGGELAQAPRPRSRGADALGGRYAPGGMVHAIMQMHVDVRARKKKQRNERRATLGGELAQMPRPRSRGVEARGGPVRQGGGPCDTGARDFTKYAFRSCWACIQVSSP